MLEHIPDKNELNRMSQAELKTLCKDIRAFILKTVSKKGGHLASNLGAVELTVALLSVFDYTKDKIIFDVGHQSYTWKIMTGRKNDFETLREYGGLSGFPKRYESEYDAFDTGHSSTSISAGIGYVKARELKKEDYHVVALIGDGSMTGGEAYEALNNASRLSSNLIIILNDNDMSISENVGGLNRYLTSIRTGKKYNKAKDDVKGTLSSIPGIGQRLISGISDLKDSVKEMVVPEGMYFENIGITYLGPVDGHNIRQLKKTLNKAKNLDRAVLIHVITRKGKGYKPAEEHPDAFHGVDAFDLKTGAPLAPKRVSWSDVFGAWITENAGKDENLCAITAAMGDNVGLVDFRKEYPDRFFDVGIAEQHAVTFAAGMAAGGLHPVVCIFSSFLQRSYDQIIHDVCMQDLPVIFCIDRAGIVGKDGETHQGAFDLAYLRPIPNLCIMAPKDGSELVKMLDFARDYHHPIAIRYPRGEAPESGVTDRPLVYGKAEVLREGKQAAILAVGDMTGTALKTAGILKEKGLEITVVNMRFVKPLDTELLERLAADHQVILTLENGMINGGFGESIAAFYKADHPEISVTQTGIPDSFVPHGNPEELKKILGLDAENVAEKILSLVQP